MLTMVHAKGPPLDGRAFEGQRNRYLRRAREYRRWRSMGHGPAVARFAVQAGDHRWEQKRFFDHRAKVVLNTVSTRLYELKKEVKRWQGRTWTESA